MSLELLAPEEEREEGREKALLGDGGVFSKREFVRR
jgi:hypothetical protein